ncbi:MAG: glycosyltransferase family 2 protein [Bacteroidota bacterium]|nr:glycosyltransferase family 2 protein [Bacteroidota bacterium]
MKISGVIITFNEERFIRQCIESIKDVVDEIVVVDSFSTDNTKVIAQEYNVRFIENKFEGFIAQKNFANSQAIYDYVLFLDADEQLSEQLKKSILDIKSLKVRFDGYSFNRLNNYCGHWVKYSGWYPDAKIRFFNRNKAKWVGENNLHEQIVLDNKESEQKLDGDLVHYAYDSVSEHWTKINKYTDIVSRYIFENQPNKKIGFSKLFLSPFWKFIKSFIFQKGYKDGAYGLIICSLAAFYTYLKYAKVKEFQLKNKVK